MGSTATTPGQGVKGDEYTESEDFVEEKPEAMEEMKAEDPKEKKSAHVKLEAIEDEQCAICREGMREEQGLFTLMSCGHAYHTPCFLKNVTAEMSEGKTLKCCLCKTPVCAEDKENLEQLLIDATIQASSLTSLHQVSNVPVPVDVPSAFDIHAYLAWNPRSQTPVEEVKGPLKISVKPITTKAKRSSSTQNPKKHHAASSQFVQQPIQN